MACNGNAEATSLLDLLPELQLRIASFLTSNDITLSFRPIGKATLALFPDGALKAIVRLSEPIPPWAYTSKWAFPDATRHLNLRQRRQLVALTASSGVVANIATAVQHAGVTLTAEVFAAAAASGQLPACTWLRDQRCSWGWTVMAAAARQGRLDVCQWLHTAG